MLKDRDFLLITAQTTSEPPVDLQMEWLQAPLPPDELKKKEFAFLDADKLQFPLELRHWQEGDFFYPFGMKGRKKLSDYFIDRKFSLLEKESALLLLSDGNVVWLAGERIDERYKIDGNTRNILKVSVRNASHPDE